jgi:hypothetical protein
LLKGADIALIGVLDVGEGVEGIHKEASAVRKAPTLLFKRR